MSDRWFATRVRPRGALPGGEAALIVALLASGPVTAAPVSHTFDHDDRLDIIEIASKAAEDISTSRKSETSGYMSARNSEYVHYEDGVASVYFTVRENLVDKAVFELRRVDYRRDARKWVQFGDETVAMDDGYLPMTVSKSPMHIESFEFRHAEFAVSVESAKIWPMWWGDELMGVSLAGEGTLKYTPPNDVQTTYIRQRLEDDKIVELIERIDRIHLLFQPDRGAEFVETLNLPFSTSRKSYASGASAESAEVLNRFGWLGIRIEEHLPFANSAYALRTSADPGLVVVAANSLDRGWLNYLVSPADSVPIKLFLEGAGVLAHSVLPADLEKPLRTVEHRRPPKQVAPLRARIDVTIDERRETRMDVVYDVELKALEDLTHIEFPMFNGKDENVRSQVDEVSQDGKPILAAWEGQLGNRVLLDPPLMKGATTTLRIRYHNANFMLRQLDPGYTYVASRGGIPWTPFIDLQHGVPLELTIRLPSRYTPISFAPMTDERVVQGQRIATFSSETPVNLPTFIYGDYKTKETDLNGLPVVMYTGKTMRSLANISLGPGERIPMTFPKLEINRGKVSQVLKEAANAISVYEELFGTKYPYEKLDLVNAPLDGGNAQSPSALVYVGNRLLVSDATLLSLFPRYHAADQDGVVAHELGHQWWGDQVWNENDYHYWFVESLSEMSAAMYLAVTEGPESYLNKVRSWKSRAMEANQDVAVQDHWRATTGAGRYGYYSMGPFVFHMFGQLFGTDQLEAAMRNLAQTYQGQGITTRDLQAVFEETVNTDLEWFFDQWVRGMGIPEITYSASWEQNEAGNWVVELKLAQEIQVGDLTLSNKAFKILVPVYVKTRDGRNLKLRVPFTEEKMVHRFELDAEPIDLTIMENEETLCRLVRRTIGPG